VPIIRTGRTEGTQRSYVQMLGDFEDDVVIEGHDFERRRNAGVAGKAPGIIFNFLVFALLIAFKWKMHKW